jgi:hypothetical protein
MIIDCILLLLLLLLLTIILLLSYRAEQMIEQMIPTRSGSREVYRLLHHHVSNHLKWSAYHWVRPSLWTSMFGKTTASTTTSAGTVNAVSVVSGKSNQQQVSFAGRESQKAMKIIF